MKILVLTPFFSSSLQDGLSLRIGHLFKYFREDHVTSIVTVDEFRRKTITAGEYDLIYIFGWHLSKEFYEVNSPNVIVDFQDVPSLTMYQMMKHDKNIFWKTMRFKWWRDILEEEKKWGRKFENFVVVSPTGVGELKRLIGEKARIATIPMGVDTAYFRPVYAEGSGEGALLFTGNMAYTSNEDAMLYFYKSIWPSVRKAAPRTRLYIVGRDPSGRVKDLAKADNLITVTGLVEDMRPFFIKSDVYVCPLRWGTGVKNKMLEAMAMGKAVVTTSIGKEGFSVEDNKELLIADDADKFADCIIRLLKDREMRMRMGQKVREVIEREYTWPSQSAKLEALIAGIIKSRTPYNK